MVDTKRRNRLKQSTMNNVVFVMTNSRLFKKKQSRKTEIEHKLDDLDSDEEWIVENEDELEDNLENIVNSNDNLVHDEFDASKVGGGSTSDDLNIPSYDDGEFDELLRRAPSSTIPNSAPNKGGGSDNIEV
ncbi:hypothetical protein PIB30_076753 [Stylosanthes scabra]|uniref:Uncharacterized protein n=1 Tax=Stylosanthes scabra TaxID=79078 RepID=A0ABU6WR48_9FABA|nr:hypothetical protein [Stylosanthes scabra]